MIKSNNLPNKIVLVSIDNLRVDCIECSDIKRIFELYEIKVKLHTPILNSLINKGAFFQQCYSAAPYTTSSHASILTGVYPEKHKVREYYRTSISNKILTIFEILKSIGYVTVFATDYPFLLGSILDFTRKIDYYIIQNDEKFSEVLHAHDKVIAFVHFGSVHSPFGLTSLEYDKSYFEDKVNQVASKCNIGIQGKLEVEWLEKDYSTRERLLRQQYFKSVECLYQAKQYDYLMDLYVEGCNYFDSRRFKEFIERIRLDTIVKQGMFILFADHGEEYSERAYAHYNGLWDSLVNVPLVILSSNIFAGRKINQVVRTVDIVPTVLEYAGISKLPLWLDGKSLKSIIEGTETESLIAYGETWFGMTKQILDFMQLCRTSNKLINVKPLANTLLQYVRTERWKLIRQIDLDTMNESNKLFDVVSDKNELINLADKNKTVVADLEKHLTKNIGFEYGDTIKLDVKDLKKIVTSFQSLGYLKGE